MVRRSLSLVLAIGLLGGLGFLFWVTRDKDRTPENETRNSDGRGVELGRDVVALPDGPSDPYDDPLPAGAFARLGTARFRQDGDPHPSVAFSVDGKVLVSASGHSVRFWDPATGKQLRLLKGHRDGVSRVCFSPDGKVLATAGGAVLKGEDEDNDTAIRLRDAVSGVELKSLSGHPAQVSALAFSPDGKALASGDAAGNTWLWSVETGTVIRRFDKYRYRVHSLAFSPDGETLATTSSLERTLRVSAVADGKTIRAWRRGDHEVEAVAFSPDGLVLVSGERDSGIHVWDTRGWREVRRIPLESRFGIAAAVFSPDGKRLAVADHDLVRVLDFDSGKELFHYKPGRYTVESVVFSPDGHYLAAHASTGTVDCRRADTGAAVARGSTHQGSIDSLAFSPGGRFIATAAHDDSVFLWDARTGRPLGRVRAASERTSSRSLVFSPNASRLFGFDRLEILDWIDSWEVSPDTETALFNPALMQGPGIALLPSGKEVIFHGPIGKLLMRSTDNPRDGEARKLPVSDLDSVEDLAVSPDGKTVVTSGSTDVLRFWDMATRRETGQFAKKDTRYALVRFSPDGRTLAATLKDRSILLLDPATRQELRRLPGHKGRITALAFAPDGLLFSGGSDYQVFLWDSDAGKKLLSFEPHDAPITALAVSPDGKTLATGSHDTTVLLWDLAALRRR